MNDKTAPRRGAGRPRKPPAMMLPPIRLDEATAELLRAAQKPGESLSETVRRGICALSGRLGGDDGYWAGSAEHLAAKARDLVRNPDAWRAMSTSERLGVALALNRHDILALMQYTIAEAIDCIGPEWVGALRQVERTIRDEIGR